jgi:hypothetical protein
MLSVAVNFHGIADCASSRVDVEDWERLQTVNACNSVIIRSRLFAVENRGISERSLRCVLTGSGISLKTCLFLNVASHVLVVRCRFAWRLHTPSCIYIELIWTVNANDSVIKWLFCRTQRVRLLSLVQLEYLDSLCDDSGQVAIISDPSCSLQDRQLVGLRLFA